MLPNNRPGNVSRKPERDAASRSAPTSRSASLVGELTQSYLRLCATATDAALNEVANSQREALRTMRWPTPLALWAPLYLATSAAMVDITRAYFELMLGAPRALTPRADPRAMGPAQTGRSSRPAFPERRHAAEPDRRARAVVINFPERRNMPRRAQD